jgi:hypothetical protein
MPLTNPTGGAIAVLKKGTAVVPAMDWKLDMDSKLKDVANFKDGRRQKATLPDADFSAKMLFDADDMPHDPAGLGFVPGAEVSVNGYVSLTKFYVIPITIAKCTVSSEIENIVMYDVTGKQNGPIVPPVIGP